MCMRQIGVTMNNGLSGQKTTSVTVQLALTLFYVYHDNISRFRKVSHLKQCLLMMRIAAQRLLRITVGIRFNQMRLGIFHFKQWTFTETYK